MHYAHRGLTHVIAAQKLTNGYPSCYIQVSSASLVDNLEVLMLTNLLLRIKEVKFLKSV